MKTLLPILKTKLFLLSFVSACTVILATTVPQIRNFIAPEKVIGEKITTEQRKVSPNTKKQNKTVNASRVTSVVALEVNNSFEATLVSDQPDYAPFSTATFTGNGFAPNEDVVLKVKNLNQPCNTVAADSSYFPWTVTADENGHFVTTWTVCNCPGDSLRLKATGQASGSIAYAYFTDADATTVVAQTGCSGNPSITFSATSTQNNTKCIRIEFPSGFAVSSISVSSPASWSGTILNAPTSTFITLTSANNLNGATVNFVVNFSTFPAPGTYTATNSSGNNENNCPNNTNGGNDISIQILADNTPPVISGVGGPSTINCPATPVFSSPTASDACSSVTLTSSDATVSTCANTYATTRKWTARDVSNNTSTADQTITVVDNTAPVITGVGGTTLTLGCNPSASDINAALGTATTTDACGTPTVSASDGPLQSSGCGRSQTRTFIATDACGNTSTTARTVTWKFDVTPPVFTFVFGDYNDVDLGCNPSASDITGALNGASASDQCSTPTITFIDESVVSDECNRSQTRTFTATDDCNNSSTKSRTVRWIADVTPPGFTGSYADVDLGCNPADPDGSLGTAAATDVCGAVTISSTDGAVVSDGCNRSRTRTFTATDGCLNTSTTSRTVRWIADLTPPSFTGNNYADVNLGCNPADPDGSLGTATASDVCGAVTISSSDGAVVSDGCSRSRTRTFTATDGCLNTSTTSRTVRWIADVTPPSFTGSYADVNLGCNPADPDGSLGTATATDVCGAVTISSTDGAVVSDGCNRSRTRTFTATDGCLNTSTTSRTVRWIADLTPPSFTGSYADVNLGCNPAAPDGSLGTATATDVCGAVTITSSDGAVVSDGCNRSRTRTFTATDGCLNTSTTSRTVRWIADVTPPSFTGSYADVNLGCNPANPDGSLGTATATDVCGAITNISSSDGGVVSSGCNRSKTRTFTATDGCLNTSTTSRTVRWIEDITPPVFTGSYADVDLGCNPANPDGSLGTATATDVCGAITNISSSDGGVVSSGCNRSKTRTFTATDGCLNTSTTSRTVRWIEDITPPVFTGSYADVDLGCNPANPDGSLGTATATDVCGAITNISSSDGGVVSSGCNRSKTRTFTATDGCLNTSTIARTVRWIEDITPPVFTGSYADVDLGCNPANPDGSLGTATATDVCGAITNISSSDGGVVSSGCNRSKTRTFTATDGCLNTSTTSRTVRWIEDVTPPGFTGVYTDVNLGCNPADPDGSLGTATATDACGAVTNITSSDGSVVSDGCNRSKTRTFTAKDGCLNSSTTSRTVRWIADLTPPSFTGSYADVNLGCNPADPDGSLGSASATDVCGAVTITQSDGAVVSDGCNRSRTRTFTATDGCLNTSTTSRTVRWIADVTPPSFTGSYADVNLGCNPANPDGSLGSASATDVCGAVTITQSDGAVVSDGCNRSRARTFTATDGCLNTSTTSRTVRWIADVTPAAFIGSYADVNLGCNPANPDGSLGSASATDVCGAVTITQSDGAVVSDGCNRSRTRTFTATDGCLNTSTTSRTVRWIADVTPPSFTGSYADVNLGCNPANPDGSLGSASATDVCGAVTITQSDGAVVSAGCNRSRTRTFTATDGCLNTSTTSRTVRWIADLTPPAFCGSYADVNLGCNPANPDGSLGTATATDVCGAVTITQSDGAVVSDGCNRSRTRTFTATDGCLNTSTTSRTVRWIADVTPPSFTGSYADVNLGCNPANPDGSLGSASATDVCGAVTITQSDGAVVSAGCNRSRTRTFTATDGCLNTSTTSRTVRWIADLTPPAFCGSYADVNLGCNPANPDGSLGTATATDVCGAVTITSSDGAVQSNGCNRSRTRTFTATDGCLNTSTTSRTVRWIADLTPPAFCGSYADVNLGCNPANPDGSLGSASATDVCGAVTITQSDGAVVSDGCNRSRTRTFTATDGCLNTSTTSRTVRWIADVTPPAFTGTYTTVAIIPCNPSASDILAALGTATATDGCGPTTITATDGSVSSSTCSRSQTRTFTAKDGCNNSATISRTVTWTADLTSPTIPATFVSQTSLWPPNHKMVDIELAASTDGCGSIASSSIVITSNEPVNDIGDGNTEVDWEIVDNNTIRLRAERSGVNDLVPSDTGRIYTIYYSVTDGCGNTSTATNAVIVAHNITNPKPGNAYPINTTISLAGTFWDVPGKTHTAKWVVDGTNVNGTVTLEPNGKKMGKVTGSFKPTVAGVYKLRMNVTDQTGLTSYATTSGDYEAYFVAYDPKGGYTYGGGQYISPAGSLTAQPNLTDMVTFGFTSNYYKNATNPKGETQIDFKLTDGEYSFGFNALNYDYLSVNGSKAIYKGLGKTTTNGIEQSGLAFIMTVIDGKNETTPDGVDLIRMKIYNKNTGAIIYDNQMGDPETADPTTAVDSPQDDGSDIVVVSTPAAPSTDLTHNAQMEVPPGLTFNVKAFPNPTEHQFTLYLEGASNEKVAIVVYDAIGRQVKKIERGDASGAIRFGENLKVGMYVVEVRQGTNRKTLKLVKQ